MLKTRTVSAESGSVAFGDKAQNNTVIINDMDKIIQAMDDISKSQEIQTHLSVTEAALKAFLLF